MPVIDDYVIPAQERVVVPAGETMTVTELRVDGRLTVYGDVFAQTIYVAPGGWMELNSGSSVTIADVEIDTLEDPHQIGNGILVGQGAKLDVNGTEKTASAALVDSVSAGDVQLVFADVPDDWEVGDTLAIADTRQFANDELGWSKVINSSSGRYSAQPIDGYWHETLAIASIDGNRVNLESPALHNHEGFAGYYPHVANLTRDVVLRSENPTGVRGHLIGFHGAQLKIVGAQIDDFGRTTVDILDSGLVSGDEVLHVGANQVGRYAIHMHHVMHGENSQIRGVAINGSPRWGIGVHGTHNLEVVNNAVWRAEGAGIVLEDGNESDIVIRGNYVGGANGSGEKIDGRKNRLGDTAFEGSGIWMRGVNRAVVEDNVAEGNAFSGYAVFQFDGAADQNRKLKVPSFSGGDPHVAGEYDVVAQTKLRHHNQLKSFDNNIAAGGRRGFDIWNLQTDHQFSNLASWNTRELAFGLFYSQNAITIESSEFFANPQIREGSLGVSHQGNGSRGDYNLQNIKVSGFDEGLIWRPTGAGVGGDSRLVGGIFQDNGLDIRVQNGDGRYETNSQIDAVLASVQLDWDVSESFQLKRGDTLQETRINGMEVFFDEQQSDHIVSNDKLFGFPGEDVSNSDLVAWGHSPTLGKITPGDAVELSWLEGGVARK